MGYPDGFASPDKKQIPAPGFTADVLAALDAAGAEIAPRNIKYSNLEVWSH